MRRLPAPPTPPDLPPWTARGGEPLPGPPVSGRSGRSELPARALPLPVRLSLLRARLTPRGRLGEVVDAALSARATLAVALGVGVVLGLVAAQGGAPVAAAAAVVPEPPPYVPPIPPPADFHPREEAHGPVAGGGGADLAFVEAQLASLTAVMEQFHLREQRYPRDQAEFEQAVMLTQPWSYPAKFHDAWGRSIRYRPVTWGYDLVSDGPDPRSYADDVGVEVRDGWATYRGLRDRRG